MRSRGESLSFAHAMLMISLAREPGLSGAQAARRAQVTAQTVNALLRNIESGGYVVRERNPENLRADRWFLTREGLRHLQQGWMVADEVARKMLVPLTAKEADRLCELLRRCAQALHTLQDAKSDAA
ncbi:MAG TPA: MarR family transcriptional regulator [Steroidobacteraceae bacterium]|nr:MarR family transcriptional regulator [Steroidobacteraceae bacterium]